MKKVTVLALHLGYGGVEKAIASLVNTICDKYEVSIICIYKLRDKPAFNIDKRVKIIYLINSDLPLVVAKYKELIKEKHFVALFKSLFNDYFAKGKFISFFKDAFNGIFMYLRRYLVTKNSIKKCNTDIIISTRNFLNKWSGKYGDNRILKIGWEHNHPHGNDKYACSVVESAVNLDYLVLVSEQIKAIYEKMFINKNCKCVCIPNCLDYIPQKLSTLNKKCMISVGRLSKEKGFDDLIEVFKEFCEIDNTWTLDIVGDGVQRNAITKMIDEYKLGNKVKLHGYQDKSYINNLLASSSIYLMTSFTESFGIVLIEAMSFGLPCIAFDSAEGASDIIINNENGFLISNRNIKEMVKTIKKLADDYELRKRIGINGRKKAMNYTKEKVNTEWLKLFESRDNNG